MELEHACALNVQLYSGINYYALFINEKNKTVLHIQ